MVRYLAFVVARRWRAFCARSALGLLGFYAYSCAAAFARARFRATVRYQQPTLRQTHAPSAR